MGLIIPGLVRAAVGEQLVWPVLGSLERLVRVLALPELQGVIGRAALADVVTVGVKPRTVAVEPGALECLDALGDALARTETPHVIDSDTGRVIAGPGLPGGHVLIHAPPYSYYVAFDADGVQARDRGERVHAVRRGAQRRHPGGGATLTDLDTGASFECDGVVSPATFRGADAPARFEVARRAIARDYLEAVRDDVRALVAAALTHGRPIEWNTVT